MQERAGNFDAPHLTAGEVTHLIVRAIRQRDARQHLIGARAAVVLADAVQGGMVGQILDHGEIEIERALLEYDADHAQSLARRMCDVAAENPDMTALDGVEARDQREQCALSSSVEAEQNGEGRRSSFPASCRRPVPPTLAKRTSRRAFPWVAECRLPPCLASALRSKTRESVSPSWLPRGKHECSGFSERREANGQAVTAAKLRYPKEARRPGSS